LILQERIADEFLEKFTALAKSIKLGTLSIRIPRWAR